MLATDSPEDGRRVGEAEPVRRSGFAAPSHRQITQSKGPGE